MLTQTQPLPPVTCQRSHFARTLLGVLVQDERRMAMRLALGHRLKHDLLEQQQARLTATSTSARVLNYTPFFTGPWIDC